MKRALRIGSVALVAVLLVVAAFLGSLVVNEPSEEDDVLVTGGELETNESTAWQWTQDRMGVDADVRPWITIANHSDVDGSSWREVQTFERKLVGDPPDDESYPLAFAEYSDRVSIHEGAIPETWNRSTRARIDEMLVHEFAHLVQWESEAFERSRETRDEGPEEQMAFDAVAEGSATYLAETYTNRTTQSYRQLWRDDDTSVHERYRLWPYIRGAAYTDARVAEPSDFESLYADPPKRPVTILRGERSASERAGRTARVELANYSVLERSAVGAAFVDSMLASAIGGDRSRTVAASVRSDQLVRLESTTDGGRYQWVWITDWNSTSTADAFAAGLERHLDDRWSRTNGS